MNLWRNQKPRPITKLTRVDHDDFKSYRSRHFPTIRVPRIRVYPPRVVLLDGYTERITRTCAATILRAAREDDRLVR